MQRIVDACGVSRIRQPLIMNGNTFTRGTFPWIVALNYQGFNETKFFCAGTLISTTFVMSGKSFILF